LGCRWTCLEMKWIFESIHLKPLLILEYPVSVSLREYSQIEKNDFADDHIGQNTQEMKRMYIVRTM
jgi:hypothetical protein